MSDHEQEFCVFCEIVGKRLPAAVVLEDDTTLAFVDPRQANTGHTLIIPKRHLRDIRELDAQTGAALMATLTRVTRAVDAAFPNEGFSLWHSIGPAAFQEVPHLHLHVMPRRTGDGLLRVYPTRIENTHPRELESIAEKIRRRL